MHIPARILRKHAMDVVPSLRDQTDREIRREEIILKAAESLIARFGAAAVTFTNLAIAIKIAPSTMRKHFTDLDALMGEMMRRHLQTISQAMGAVPRDAPDRRRLQRAAYIEATRFLGAPTEAHLIYTTYRAILAEDERTTIEEIRDVIGNTLCPENPAGTLDLLDSPNFDPAEIEAMIAAANAARSAFAPPLPADAIAAHAETPAPIPAIEPPEDIDMAWSRIGGVEIPGGPLCQPRKRQPWDTPERLLSDAELHLAIAEARAPPTSLAA